MRAIDAIRNNQRHARTGVTRLAPILAAALACTTAANAAMIFGPPSPPPPVNYTWNGAASSNWSDAGNWTPNGGPPTYRDTVTISAPTVSNPPSWNPTAMRWDININVGNQRVAEVTINTDARVVVDNGITIKRDLTANANVTLVSAQSSTRVVDVQDNLRVGQTSAGSITISDNAKLKVRDNTQIGSGQAGTVTVNNQGQASFGTGVTIGGQSAGALNVNTGANNAVVANGPTVVGAATTGTPAHSGALNVADGATYKANGDVTIAQQGQQGQNSGSGAVQLTGSGSLEAKNRNVTVGQDGLIEGVRSGGTDAGEITASTLTNGGTIRTDGQTTINGNVTLTGTSRLEIAISALRDFGSLKVTGTVSVLGDLVVKLIGGYSPDQGTTFKLIKARTINGQFNGVPNGHVIHQNGNSLRISYHNKSVNAKAIPSPGAGALAAIGLGLIVIRRTRAG